MESEGTVRNEVMATALRDGDYRVEMRVHCSFASSMRGGRTEAGMGHEQVTVQRFSLFRPVQRFREPLESWYVMSSCVLIVVLGAHETSLGAIGSWRRWRMGDETKQIFTIDSKSSTQGCAE